ncbi:DUF3426 domain-containing protein [Cupriavidus sp. IDO]|uniref:DUF3426 domain-containing protein n=1 Tax=Cupriavidus sp. IDO TaxID=1539142 RepID=UPI0005794CB6|nr:DUF3426 domain-containing protein [Cupriavidus sp. IDO]KWR75700.1 hypothetical protein RM96_33805 [Cupriavidus sp. IDO]
MAAAKLVTRCPACRTAFRLVADQLRLRQGLVRCGHCDTVFDAREHLIEVPVQAGPSASAAQKPPAPAAAIAPEAETPRPRIPDFDPGYDPGYDVPALDSPTMMMSPSEDAGQDDHATEAEPGDVAAEAADAAEVAAKESESHRAEAGSAAEPEMSLASPEAAPEPSVATPAAAAWPALDHGALEDSDRTHTPAQEFEAEAPAGETPAAAAESKPFPPPAVTLSAGEFLRAASSDISAEDAEPRHGAPAGQKHEPSFRPTPVHEPARDYGHNYGPAYGPEPSSPANDFSATAGAIAREQATRRWKRYDQPAGPVFAPDFLRQARERERGRAGQPGAASPARRQWWWAAAAVLGVGIIVQGVYLARSQLAGQFPMLRPALEAACAPVGCTVPPWRDIDALRIDTSQLQKQDDGSDAYLLAVTLRNQGRATTALPAIELVMTDLQDQLLLRRVLQPADYLEPAQKAFAAHGLRAGTELPVRVRFRTQQAAANYRVLIFYP